MHTVYLLIRSEVGEWDGQHETIHAFIDLELAKRWKEWYQEKNGYYAYMIIMMDITKNLPS